MSTTKRTEVRWFSYRGMWRSQPNWARKMYVFVTIPTWLVFVSLILSGRFETHPIIGGIVVMALVIEAIVHNNLWLEDLFARRR